MDYLFAKYMEPFCFIYPNQFYNTNFMHCPITQHYTIPFHFVNYKTLMLLLLLLPLLALLNQHILIWSYS